MTNLIFENGKVYDKEELNEQTLEKKIADCQLVIDMYDSRLDVLETNKASAEADKAAYQTKKDEAYPE